MAASMTVWTVVEYVFKPVYFPGVALTRVDLLPVAAAIFYYLMFLGSIASML